MSMLKTMSRFWAACLVSVVISCTGGHSQDGSDSQTHGRNRGIVMTNKQLDGNISAPDFPDHLQWLNTDGRYTLSDFRGKIVLLDFWTFCCINCMHVIPDLKKLEAKYPEELVVIGVHSAKFENEQQTAAIRQAILRYEIEHPVINDNNFEVWRAYNISAWPSLMLINPNGKIIGRHSGEGIFEPFNEIISQAIEYFDAKGELKRSPLELSLISDRQPDRLLSFPGKVKADADSHRLFITDSNHDRIIITDPDGAILDVIGSSLSGSADGSFENASFNHPQGTFLTGGVLYIADTENHTIRAADLKNRTVSTVAGTGSQARQFNQSGTGTEVALNSPWDIVGHDNKLYIAMAGFHQLWSLDLATMYLQPHAGSGRENRVDGDLLESALAQPSGISTDGVKLYFADSEVSSIRQADINPDGSVETIIGEGLFEFGDIDGSAARARLQHPLGVVFKDGLLYVADTYNSKIKIIDPTIATVTTLAGDGSHGLVDGQPEQARFNEPSGITFLDNKLYVADGNNHVIRVIDMETSEVSTLSLSNVELLSRNRPVEFTGRELTLPLQTIMAGSGTIGVTFDLPQGYELTTDAPLYFQWSSGDEAIIQPLPESSGDHTRAEIPASLAIRTTKGSAVLTLDAVIYFCRKGSPACLINNVRVKLPIEVTEDGRDEIGISIPVYLPGDA